MNFPSVVQFVFKMVRCIIFLSIIFLLLVSAKKKSPSTKPKRINCISDVTRLIRRDGCPAEEHKIRTQDGYILTAHRIPGCTRNSGITKNEPVLFLHGLFFGSPDWLLIGTDHALPYMMAKNGTDVWILNFRGNTYSQRHTHLNSRLNPIYWNFSWHEMGTHDVNSTIAYILSRTGKSNVNVVCHSQGCAAAFVAGVYHPHLNRQIKSMCAFAPAAYLSNTRNRLVRMMAMGEAFTRPTMFHQFSLADLRAGAATLCSNAPHQMCEMYLSYGFSFQGTNRTIIPTIPCYTPSSVSTKQLYHFLQNIRRHTFAHFNYGPAMNMATYGSPAPPNYNLRQVKYPVCLYYAVNDRMVVPEDARRTGRALGNLKSEHLVRDTSFGHYDFLYGRRVSELVYRQVIQEMQ